MSKPIIRQSGKLKEIVGIGQTAIKEALPKMCHNFKKKTFLIDVVVVNMFIFVGKNSSLGPGHIRKLYVHLSLP